ncbi:MAG TPA: oligosaccharide flippase family protein, partial [Dongiaceae bacterium]|nr:oligosaccharide flippase family protein [Dongiaceae bacterium]
LAFRLVVSGVAAALLIALGGPIAAALLHGEAYRKYVGVGAATLPFTLLVLFCNDVLRVTFQPVKYITLNLVQTVLVTTLSIVFVGPFHLSTAGVLYGRLAGDALSSLVGLVLIRHALGHRFDRGTLRRMLAYGAPTIPAAFAFALITGLDRFWLQRTRTIEEVATYSVALRFLSVMTFAASAFQLAYGPFVYARARDPGAPRLFARVLVGYIAVASLGAMIVGLFAPEVLRVLVTRAYHPDAASLPALLLAFAAVALGAYTVGSIGIGLALKTPLLAVGAWSGAVVAAAAHATLTPRLGPSGAAIATLAGYVSVAGVTFVLAQRVHPLPYRGARAAGLFALALVLALLAQRLAPPGAWGVAVRAAAVLMFAGVCARAKVWTERAAVAAPRPAPAAGDAVG